MDEKKLAATAVLIEKALVPSFVERMAARGYPLKTAEEISDALQLAGMVSILRSNGQLPEQSPASATPIKVAMHAAAVQAHQAGLLADSYVPDDEFKQACKDLVAA